MSTLLIRPNRHAAGDQHFAERRGRVRGRESTRWLSEPRRDHLAGGVHQKRFRTSDVDPPLRPAPEVRAGEPLEGASERGLCHPDLVGEGGLCPIVARW